MLEPGVGRYISGEETVWEREPLERLARDGQLVPYYHEGFWHAMDTIRERQELEALWASGDAPWCVWA